MAASHASKPALLLICVHAYAPQRAQSVSSVSSVCSDCEAHATRSGRAPLGRGSGRWEAVWGPGRARRARPRRGDDPRRARRARPRWRAVAGWTLHPRRRVGGGSGGRVRGTSRSVGPRFEWRPVTAHRVQRKQCHRQLSEGVWRGEGVQRGKGVGAWCVQGKAQTCASSRPAWSLCKSSLVL